MELGLVDEQPKTRRTQLRETAGHYWNSYKTYVYVAAAIYGVMVAIIGISAIYVLAQNQKQEIENYKIMSRQSYIQNSRKRDQPISCNSSQECGHGTCVKSNIIDAEYVCECDDFYINRHNGTCNYKMRPKLNTFMASFFGGGVGADWFYLARGSSRYNGAGAGKLLTACGLTIWCTVDWIRVLCDGFPDGNGVTPTKWS